MIFRIFFILYICIISPPALAGTSVSNQISCPIDGTKFQVREVASLTVFGYFRDFQMYGGIGGYYRNQIHSCPVCHYSGRKDDFEHLVATQLKQKVMAELMPINSGKPLSLLKRYEVAAELYQWQNRSSLKIANLYLSGSYIARSYARARVSYFQKQAIKFYIKAWQKGEIIENQVVKAYLIGDLLRRTSQFDLSLEWFSLAQKLLGPKKIFKYGFDMGELIFEQEQLSLRKDANNEI